MSKQPEVSQPNKNGWTTGMRLYNIEIESRHIPVAYVYVNPQGRVWLCQNEKNGNAIADEYKGGFRYSWNIVKGSEDDCWANGVDYNQCMQAICCMNE